MASQRKFAQIIAAEPTLADLHRRVGRVQVLQQLCRKALPSELKDSFRVGEPIGQELRLFVDNGAVASRLRHCTPELLTLLECKGYEFTGIRIGVQVRISPGPAKKSVTKHIDEQGRASLARFAQTLPEHAALRQAVQRLIDRCRDQGETTGS